MNNVNKTLYIPLYGKSFVSQNNLFIKDKKAEKIWKSEGFVLKGKAKSKWLAYYMGIRSAVFDSWVKSKISEMQNAVVIHIGCGLDSRVERISADCRWYDLDFESVISERKLYYNESESYKMLAGDAAEREWLDSIQETESAIVVMEGVSMYMSAKSLSRLFENIGSHFKHVALIADFYTVISAKISKYKNPIKEVGVSEVYGTGTPELIGKNVFNSCTEMDMTPEIFINELGGMERRIFKGLYAGKISKKLYKLFAYEK